MNHDDLIAQPGTRNTKRVRIVNNGQSAHMTSVTNTETGEAIPNVSHVGITLYSTGRAIAMITTELPMIDIIAEAEIEQVCSCCGQLVEDKGKEMNTQ